MTVKLRAWGWLVVIGVCSLMAAGWWASPRSPAALNRPASLLAQGNSEAALEAYLKLADRWVSDDTRLDALWFAALIAHVDLDRPKVAAETLELCLDLEPTIQRQVMILDRLARVAVDTDANESASWWRKAAQIAPTHPQAGRRWIQSGLASMEAGEPLAAEQALLNASEHHIVAVQSYMLLAQLSLQDNPAAAHAYYDAVLTNGVDGVYESVAIAGRHTAEEMLNKAGAVADLDDQD